VGGGVTGIYDTLRRGHKAALKAGCPAVPKGYFWEPRQDGSFALLKEVPALPGTVKVRYVGERTADGKLAVSNLEDDLFTAEQSTAPALSNREEELRNGENKKTFVADDRGRGSDHDQRSGLDTVGDSRSGVEPKNVAPRPAQVEVENAAEIKTERGDFPAGSGGWPVASADADLRPDGRLAVGGGEDLLSERLAKLGAVTNLPTSASVGNSAQPTPFVVGNSFPKSEIPTTDTHVGISGQGVQNQQLPLKLKTEWYRYELDFRPLKKGYTVLLRKRLRWSDTRYSKTILTNSCPQLTVKMVQQISVGKFTAATIAALQNGGIADGFIRDLQERIGKGNGRRRADLTEHERALLARIESGLSAGSRGRNRGSGS
jgi:hypothetical protein